MKVRLLTKLRKATKGVIVAAYSPRGGNQKALGCLTET